MYFKILLSFVCLSICLQNVIESRKVTLTVNPNCTTCDKPDSNGSYANLVWAKLVGDQDEIHFLYSTIDSFTIMAFKTNLSASLSIDWKSLSSKNASQIYNSIKLTPAPIESAGYSLPIIYEYDDQDGVGNMTKIPNNSSYWVLHETQSLVWSQVQINDSSVITFEGKHSKGSNGTIRFVIKLYGEDDKRDDNLPHLLSNAQSSVVDFVLDSLDPTFKDSKFGVNVVLLSNFKDITLETKKTLDDEYTPGTFNMWSIQTTNSNTNEVNSYFEWKPIFYFYDPRSLENSTITYQYDLDKNQTLPIGIGAAFFNQKSFVYGFNVSFGIEGNEKDGYFYTQTNYSVWSFSCGIGSAPAEKMSYWVSLVIAIGFGLPALVIVVGLFALMVRKCRSSNYSEL